MKRLLSHLKGIYSNNRRFSDDGKIEPLIMVHGGAGTTIEELVIPKVRTVKDAVVVGFKSLIQVGAVEAVEQAIKFMDTSGHFNSGKGSVLNACGAIEIDAAIMRGDLSAGAVSCVKNIESPIRLARLIMESRKCLMLTSTGALEFAKANGIEILEPDILISDRAKKLLKEKSKYCSTQVGIMGAVALDKDGNLAAGTSSGGSIGRMPGASGDCCRIGCSIYADNRVAAVSTTGNAESIIKTCLALSIKHNIESGISTSESIQKGLFCMDMKMQQCGGAIVLTKNGEIGFYFNSKRMPWAYHNGVTVHYGVEKGEHNVESSKI